MKLEIHATDKELFALMSNHLPARLPVWEGVTETGHRVQCLVIAIDQPQLPRGAPALEAPQRLIEAPE